MSNAIEVEGLTKVYEQGQRGAKPVVAVDHVSFQVQPGEIFGFLGPNGAGKTTTIRMLTGLTQPTSGRASILGFDLFQDVTRIKKQIGVVPERSNLYDELSAYGNLEFSMQLYGVPRAEWRPRAGELLEHFRLGEKRDTPFAKLSRGMKRALTIAAALAHRPPLIFLDEPTTGLDVMNARSLRKMIAGLRDQGVTVFLTTHYMEEAERLCDRIAIIVQGQIVALDTVEGLKKTTQNTNIIEITFESETNGAETRRFEDRDVAKAVQMGLSRAKGRRLLALNTIRPTLEDVFVRLTGLDREIMLAEKGGKEPGNAGG
jgi:ABC-2 type transport system ATP-binding protein